MNTIIWKGVPSTNIEGLLISELPPISKPPMRVKETMIDGRDGSIIEELGYEPYNKPVTIGLRGNFDINRVIKYFTGEGEIIFSNEPDKVYTAKVISQIDYNRLLRFRTAVVSFRVQPYKNKYNEAFKETQTVTATGTNLVLKDSGRTPMHMGADYESVVVHGKNIFNPNAIDLNTNTSQTFTENGYKIVVVGGTKTSYTASRYALPIAMRGKSYCLKCDKMISEQQSIRVCSQVVIKTTSTPLYYPITQATTSQVFSVPKDATEIAITITTNDTPNALGIDNKVTIYGLMLTPAEFKDDSWCAFARLQTLEVIDGVADATGYEPVTVISNAANAEMTVEYIKPFEVFNEGLENSKPKMVLRGSGTVGISVNGIHIFDYTFPDGESEVVIDSEKEDAYLGSALKNRNMNGEFPVLLAGTNKIEWSGSVESIEILPRSRWL